MRETRTEILQQACGEGRLGIDMFELFFDNLILPSGPALISESNVNSQITVSISTDPALSGTRN